MSDSAKKPEMLEAARMDENAQNVINAYSMGPVCEKWGAKRGDLHGDELALMQTYCQNHDAAILTVGCGAGRETFALYKLGFRNVRGIDCTDALLQIARNRNKEEGYNIEFELATADKLPYPSKMFDVVTVFDNVYGFITPHSARLKSLAEMSRVLKPGGLIMMNVSSIYNHWRHFAFIKMTEMFRTFYNLHGMEKGDKFWGEERRARPRGKSRTITHWFRPNDVLDDARQVGLPVLLATTSVSVCKSPKENSAKIHKQGRLIYVLQRPV